MKRTPLFIPLACLGLALLAGGRESAAEDPSHELVLGKCRIKLVDEVTLAAERPGIIEIVHFDEGDTIEDDAIVAQLKDLVAQATLAIAEEKATNDVDVRYAEKATDVARAEYDKAVETNEISQSRGRKDIVPEVEVERLRLTWERSKLQIESARRDQKVASLELEEARSQLATYQVLAPFAGMVTRVYKAKGEAVNQGDPILDIVNTKRVRVEGELHIGDLWNISTGDRVEVQLDIPNLELDVEDRVFHGELKFIDVSVLAPTRTVRVWAEVENESNILREGLYAIMRIYPSDRKTALSDSEEPAE